MITLYIVTCLWADGSRTEMTFKDQSSAAYANKKAYEYDAFCVIKKVTIEGVK